MRKHNTKQLQKRLENMHGSAMAKYDQYLIASRTGQRLVASNYHLSAYFTGRKAARLLRKRFDLGPIRHLLYQNAITIGLEAYSQSACGWLGNEISTLLTEARQGELTPDETHDLNELQEVYNVLAAKKQQKGE